MYENLKKPITVTLSGEDWAKVFAAVSMSRLELTEKELINASIYDCVMRSDNVQYA